MHQLQLRMLDCIHEYCMNNNIRYSLGGGTLLGAIRHKGFIPWDDDVDIMMPRPDYERFITGFQGRYEHCVLQHWKTDPNYYNLFAKVYDDRTILTGGNYYTGVYVDIFPIDGIPHVMDHIIYHKRYKPRKMLVYIKRTHFVRMHWKMQVLTVITYPILCLIPRYKLMNFIESYILKYDFESSECTGCVVGRYGTAEYMGHDTFKKYIDVEFEGRILKCIADFDEYLTLHYGDYIKLPPFKERIQSHTYKRWWKNT